MLAGVCKQQAGKLDDLLLSSSVEVMAFGAKSIEWLSPLQPTYYEYRDDFLDVLGLKQFESVVPEFWPAQGPQPVNTMAARTSKENVN